MTQISQKIMAFETKEDILEKILALKRAECPHCNSEMNLWEVPEINFSDGSGWGTPYLYVCFNDDCSPYVQGWENMKKNYAQKASYRCICYPGTKQFELMSVFSPVGGTGQIVDDEILMQRQAVEEAIKKGFSILATCYVEKDWLTVLNLLLNPTEPSRVRIKAAEMIGDIGPLGSIDPIQNHSFGNALILEKATLSIKKMLEKNFRRQCPLCLEIIKKKAVICKHCGQNVAGR